MNNNEMLRFRESFRGYNRDDVNAYIEQLSLHFSKKEADLRVIISDLESKLNHNENTHTEAEFDDLKSQLDALKSENSRLQSELDATNQCIENEAEEKSKLYDSMSAQVGSIIIQANTNADKIISDAKQEAENIKTSASITSKEILDEAQRKKDETIKNINEILNTASKECVNLYSDIINDTNERLKSIGDYVRSRAEAMLTDLENKASQIKGE